MNYELHFRIIVFIVFTITVAISGFYRRRARQSGETIPRLKEGKLALIGRLTIGLAFLILILLYVFIPRWIGWSMFSAPLWSRWIGVAVAFLCPILGIWVLKYIGKNISETVHTKQEHQLVTTGPYFWVRHPLYTTGLLLIYSLGLVASNWIILIMGLIGTIVFRFFVIPIEEKHLIEKFGKQYKDYQASTGALIPRL